MAHKKLGLYILILVLLVSPFVSAANLTDTLGKTLGTLYLDISGLYMKFPQFVDFILYIIFFIALSQVVMAGKFGGKGGFLGTMFAIMLAIMASVFEWQTGWSLGAFLPPIAILIVIGSFGVFLYWLVAKFSGEKKWAMACAYIGLYLMANAFYHNWIRNFSPPIKAMADWMLYIGQWVFWWAIMSLIIHLVKSAGKGGEDWDQFGKGLPKLGGLVGSTAGAAKNAYRRARDRTRRTTRNEEREEAQDNQVIRDVDRLTQLEIEELEQMETNIGPLLHKVGRLEIQLREGSTGFKVGVAEIREHIARILHFWRQANSRGRAILDEIKVLVANEKHELTEELSNYADLKRELAAATTARDKGKLAEVKKELDVARRSLFQHKIGRNLVVALSREERGREGHRAHRITQVVVELDKFLAIDLSTPAARQALHTIATELQRLVLEHIQETRVLLVKVKMDEKVEYNEARFAQIEDRLEHLI